MEKELVMYLVVNKELGMSAGKMSGQVAHCVTNYMEHIRTKGDAGELERYKEWYQSGNVQKKIILGGKQKDLEKLEKLGMFWSVRDLGLTEIASGSLTCVCLGVMAREKAAPYVKRLQLFV